MSGSKSFMRFDFAPRIKTETLRPRHVLLVFDIPIVGEQDIPLRQELAVLLGTKSCLSHRFALVALRSESPFHYSSKAYLISTYQTRNPSLSWLFSTVAAIPASWLPSCAKETNRSSVRATALDDAHAYPDPPLLVS
jgi:hypothetical protein